MKSTTRARPHKRERSGMAELAARLDRIEALLTQIHQELEAHICPAQTRIEQSTARLAGLWEGTWSELNRVDTKAAAILGIKERAELTLLEHIPEWPRTQAEIPDLEEKRAQRLNLEPETLDLEHAHG